MKGIINRSEDLWQYENLWHFNIITDTRLGLKELVSDRQHFFVVCT